MGELISHTRWMTTLAAGLATAKVSLPPIAVETVEVKGLGVVAFVVLGVSAWCGAIAAKLYVSYQLPFDEMIAVLGAGQAPEQLVNQRKAKAMKSGSRWALVQQLLFVLGSVLAGVFFVVNL